MGSERLSTPSVNSRQHDRSPRVLRTHLHAYACRIYVTAFRARTGLCIYWPAHPAVPPLSASCSSGQRFAYSFLQIPPHDGHPCRSANTSPCRVCRGLSPPSECALPGAPKKQARDGDDPCLVGKVQLTRCGKPNRWRRRCRPARARVRAHTSADTRPGSDGRTGPVQSRSSGPGP